MDTTTSKDLQPQRLADKLFKKVWDGLANEGELVTSIALVDICGDHTSAVVLTHLVNCYMDDEHLFNIHGTLWVQTTPGHWWKYCRLGNNSVKTRCSNLHNRGFLDYSSLRTGDGDYSFLYCVNFSAVERAIRELGAQHEEAA